MRRIEGDHTGRRRERKQVNTTSTLVATVIALILIGLVIFVLRKSN